MKENYEQEIQALKQELKKIPVPVKDLLNSDPKEVSPNNFNTT
jgi:hypothetical protein